jgi:hypothetical protein
MAKKKLAEKERLLREQKVAIKSLTVHLTKIGVLDPKKMISEVSKAARKELAKAIKK